MMTEQDDDAELAAIRSSDGYARAQWGIRTMVAAVGLGVLTALFVPLPIPHILTALCGVVAFVAFITGVIAVMSAVIAVNKLTIPFVYGGQRYPDSGRSTRLMRMILTDLTRRPGKPL
jgi:hypothetical protein